MYNCLYTRSRFKRAFIILITCLTIYFWLNIDFATNYKNDSIENSGFYLNKNWHIINTLETIETKESDALDGLSLINESDIPIFKVKDVSCEKLFNKDNEAYKRADEIQGEMKR